MPKDKPQRPAAPKGARRSYAIVPTPIVAKLAGLASVSNDEIFRKGITYAVRKAHEDFPRLSQPVYAGQVIERVDEIRRTALLLQKLLDALQKPQDRTAIRVGRLLIQYLPEKTAWGNPLTRYGTQLSKLAEAAENAKNSPWIDELKERGRPSGVGGTGDSLSGFIRMMEFGARAAGGRWTLNKNDERGTLIDALELLRAFLPDDFLPAEGKHPYSSYQTILTGARSDWKHEGVRSFFAMAVAGYGKRSKLTAREMGEVKTLALAFETLREK